ncbi:ribosome silencing factor [Candidatus Latescibacterota bacterium]
MSSKKSYDVEKNVERIIDLIMEKKGEDIVVLDLRDISSVADFFIVVSGNSNVHVRAIADGLREKLKKDDKILPWHIEGFEAQRWILIDYVDIVVHIFDYEAREYYSIEKLWEDSKSRKIETFY